MEINKDTFFCFMEIIIPIIPLMNMSKNRIKPELTNLSVSVNLIIAVMKLKPIII
jgi:hypothetical protein